MFLYISEIQPTECLNVFIFGSLLCFLQYIIFFLFGFFGREVCGILATQPEPNMNLLHWEAVLTTGPPGKSLNVFIFKCLFRQTGGDESKKAGNGVGF